MAKIADVTFTGQSGRKYKFGVYPPRSLSLTKIQRVKHSNNFSLSILATGRIQANL